MIILKDSKYIVMDKITKQVISEHPYTTDYEQKKAKEAAQTSNDQWKESHAR